MPHRHTPKVDRAEWHDKHQELYAKIDEISMDIQRLVSRMDAVENKCCDANRSSIEHTQEDISARLDRLESVYIVVDFITLEKAASQILHDMPGDSIQTYGGESQFDQQKTSLCELAVAFEYLDGMVKDMGCNVGPYVVHGSVTDDIAREGDSKLQHNLIVRETSEQLVKEARDNWDSLKNFGESGSLIILGCKKYVETGMLVEAIPQQRIFLRTYDGQNVLTVSAMFEIWENGRHGITLKDTTHDSNGTCVCGRVAKQNSTLQFRIVGHIF